MPHVTLDWYEVAIGAQVGMRRQLMSLSRGSEDAHGARGIGWSEHIAGALGEMAVAKTLGRYWSGSVGTFHAADIGRSIQVRTRSDQRYELLVRPNDDDASVFVLARGSNNSFDVVGWATGAEAKRPEWMHDYGNRPAAYFVPDDALHDIAELGAAVGDLECEAA